MSGPASPNRLERLLEGLYKAAVSKGKVRLPVVSADDAALVCGFFHAQVDRGTEARARRAAESGHAEACGKGCDHCCNNAPAVFAGESVTIASWLDQPEHAELRAGFLGRYPAWHAKVADLLNAWTTAAAAGDAEAAAQALAGVWRRGVMCAFNQDGACTIYPVRPNVCRSAHALDTSDHCKPGSDNMPSPATQPFPPLDDFFVQIRPVVFAMHAALQKSGAGNQPVCVAVHDLLAD